MSLLCFGWGTFQRESPKFNHFHQTWMLNRSGMVTTPPPSFFHCFSPPHWWKKACSCPTRHRFVSPSLFPEGGRFLLFCKSDNPQHNKNDPFFLLHLQMLQSSPFFRLPSLSSAHIFLISIYFFFLFLPNSKVTGPGLAAFLLPRHITDSCHGDASCQGLEQSLNSYLTVTNWFTKAGALLGYV